MPGTLRRIYLTAMMALMCLFSVVQGAEALREPRALPTDRRIQIVTYHPNDVIRYTGHYEYQSSIVFEEGETIETISMGNTQGWQVVPSSNRLFLKPVENNADTNMTIISNKRLYQFELHAQEVDPELGMNDPNLVFELRIIYPGSGSNVNISGLSSGTASGVQSPSAGLPDLTQPEKLNFNYSVSGDEYIAPIRIFDDGEFTYFQFSSKNATIPAFFVVDTEGREALVNYRAVGDYIVLERVVSQLTLRDGKDTLCVYNEAKPLGKKKS